MFIQKLQIGRSQSTLEITSQYLGINGHWREHTSQPFPTSLSSGVQFQLL